MKSVKRLSRYISILLSVLLTLTAVSPGITALAQEKASAVPAALSYEDTRIKAELQTTDGTSLPAGAALTVKALNKDSQDKAEKALYAETEAGLNDKASEQGTTVDGFTAYSITLTKNGRDVTPDQGAFTLKLTDKNAAAPEAYTQSQDPQKNVELYQKTEAKDQQNTPVSAMEPKQAEEASINADPAGNLTEVQASLTTLKPIAVAWQSPAAQPAAEENALSVQSRQGLAENQFSYSFKVNGKTDVDPSNLVIDFKENDMWGNDLDIFTLLDGKTSATKEVVAGTPIPIADLLPEGLNGYKLVRVTLLGPDNVMYDDIQSVTVKANNKGTIISYLYKTQAWHNPIEVNINDAGKYNLYFTCLEDLKTIPTIDSASKGVEIQMFDYPSSLPNWKNVNGVLGWGIAEKGQLKQDLLKRTLTTNADGEKIPVRADNQGNLSANFSTKNNDNYRGTANHLFSEAAYNADGTFSYSSFENFAYLDQKKTDKKGNKNFTVYQALGTPKDDDQTFCFQRGNFFPYNKIDKSVVAYNNKNYYDENGKALESSAPRYGELLYLTLNENGYPEQNDYFGMVVTANFIQQKDGKYNDKNMVYNFNGDDDMWVFIDDVLVLDLGGVHDAQSGSIDFATGEVKWSNNASNGNTITPGSGSSTIKEQFNKAKSENTVEWNNNGNIFADYTGHEIKIFYMERGAGASNCKMQFNLPTVPKDSISVTKEVTNVNEGAYTDVDFQFKLFLEAEQGEDINGKETIKDKDGKNYVLATNEPYTLKDGSAETPNQNTNSNGIFKLKHGQTAYFNGEKGEGITQAGKKYIVQEVGVDKTQYDQIKVTANATDENGVSVTEKPGEDGKIIVQTEPLTVGTNMIVKMQNHCDANNLHAINITKAIAGGQTSEDTFTAQVTIGGKPYTGKYKIADKDATEDQWKSAEEQTTDNGSISLKANQTIRIERIAAGTSFEVTEQTPDANKYNAPTYGVSDAAETNTDNKASGKVELRKNPQITITNHPNFNDDSLQISKTATVKDWNARTYTITLTAHSTGGQVTGATIQDTIDPRFDVVDTDGNKLSNNADVDGGTLHIAGNKVYIRWENQTLGTEATSWTKQINLKAKEDYIGGNNVPTNVAGDEESFVTANSITKPFGQPKVNVKDILTLSNVTNTVFYGDKPSDADITAVTAAMNRNSTLKDMNAQGGYAGIDQTKLEYHWYSAKAENNTLSDPVSNIKTDLEIKLDSLETATPLTYYLQITCPMGQSTEESAGNTNNNIAGNATAIDTDSVATAINDGKAAVNGTEPSDVQNPNDLKGKLYGVYTNNIVKGQLEITKEINDQYTKISQINANQTFVFKIERYKAEENGSKGSLAETFYETINFNANEMETTKAKLISGLKKGYYTVTEETNWSQKYDLEKTEDNYAKNSKEAVDLLIGDRLRPATNENPKPEFYGLDETELKGSDGNELPSAQQYSNFADGEKAAVKFTNNLNKDWKWLSDTAAAVNIFGGSAAN